MSSVKRYWRLEYGDEIAGRSLYQLSLELSKQSVKALVQQNPRRA